MLICENSLASDITFDYLVGTDAVEAIEVHPGRDDGEDDFEVGEEEEEDENVDEGDFEEGVEDAEGIMEDDTGMATARDFFILLFYCYYCFCSDLK